MSTQAAPRRITRIGFLVSIAILLFSFIASSRGHRAAAGQPQSEQSSAHCTPVGGTVMTNLGVVDQSTTLGVVDGDLKGAVAATILNVAPGSGGTTVFTVQHHFVTQAGDTILVDQATATTKEVLPGSGLFAILNYPVHIKGGSGKFAGATGDFNNIGAADLGTGRTVFRYSGQVCFAGRD
jgi:hypothetical protein